MTAIHNFKNILANIYLILEIEFNLKVVLPNILRSNERH